MTNVYKRHTLFKTVNLCLIEGFIYIYMVQYLVTLFMYSVRDLGTVLEG